jgi:hypothetical protein
MVVRTLPTGNVTSRHSQPAESDVFHEVIAVRAEADRAALGPLPERLYLVAERHLRRVGKDCLISFEASCYSVPARLVRPGQRVRLLVVWR